MLSVLFGLIGIVVGVLWLVSWEAWDHFLVVLQGSIPPFLILVGLVALAAGISSIKDKAAAKKEEEKLEEGSVTEESSEEDSEEVSEEKFSE
ncbi:MAG: hypothetical protein U9R36_04650 [Elusimicrobiota bacterium]|nr:hypothetical protein [Elusimicrobiota bacterium]